MGKNVGRELKLGDQITKKERVLLGHGSDM